MCPDTIQIDNWTHYQIYSSVNHHTENLLQCEPPHLKSTPVWTTTLNTRVSATLELDTTSSNQPPYQISSPPSQ